MGIVDELYGPDTAAVAPQDRPRQYPKPGSLNAEWTPEQAAQNADLQKAADEYNAQQAGRAAVANDPTLRLKAEKEAADDATIADWEDSHGEFKRSAGALASLGVIPGVPKEVEQAYARRSMRDYDKSNPITSALRGATNMAAEAVFGVPTAVVSDIDSAIERRVTGPMKAAVDAANPAMSLVRKGVEALAPAGSDAPLTAGAEVAAAVVPRAFTAAADLAKDTPLGNTQAGRNLLDVAGVVAPFVVPHVAGKVARGAEAFRSAVDAAELDRRVPVTPADIAEAERQSKADALDKVNGTPLSPATLAREAAYQKELATRQANADDARFLERRQGPPDPATLPPSAFPDPAAYEVSRGALPDAVPDRLPHSAIDRLVGPMSDRGPDRPAPAASTGADYEPVGRNVASAIDRLVGPPAGGPIEPAPLVAERADYWRGGKKASDPFDLDSLVGLSPENSSAGRAPLPFEAAAEAARPVHTTDAVLSGSADAPAAKTPQQINEERWARDRDRAAAAPDLLGALESGGDSYSVKRAQDLVDHGYSMDMWRNRRHPLLSVERFRTGLEDITKSPEKAQALFEIVQARARALRKPVEHYIEDRFIDVRSATHADELRRDALAREEYQPGHPRMQAYEEAGVKIDPTRPARAGGWAEFETGGLTAEREGRAIIVSFSKSLKTALHELAHVFRRDLTASEMEMAGPWAGAEKGPGFWKWSRAAEEKFAYAFNKYMEEGRAPTKGLAGVFEKFKTWLSNVFDAVRGNNFPISDEVRATFDKMLGGKPKRAAVPAPDQPPGPVLAIGLHPTVQRLLGTPFAEHIANLKSWGRRLLGDAYDNPDLAEFNTDEAGYRMDHAAAKRRQWYRNATDIAGLRVNALVGKDIPEAYLMDTSENVPTLRALPNLYRNRALLREGKSAGKGITEASNEAAIRFNEAGVPQQYRDLFMGRYKAMNDALLAEERAAGVDVKDAEDYSHRIAMDHQEGKSGGGSRYGAVADRSPGFAKETVGSSELEFEPDALRAFFVRNVAHEHLLASREMASKIKDNPSLNLNDQLRSGAVQWSKGDHAVYRFGEKGSQAGEMSDAVDSANAVKLALEKERDAQARGEPAPAPNAPLLDEQGKPIYVVPKQLARGLVKAGQAADMTNIAQVVRKITSKVQSAYLNFPLNYNYHATQVWQDSMSVLKNVLPQDAAPAVRAAFKAAKELAKDLEAVREGKMPTYLPEQLRRGLAGGRFETYMNEEVTNGHIVNDSMVPGRLRPINLKSAAGVKDAAGRAWVFWIEHPENLVGLFRETVAKAALDEVYRNRMGATPNQAARMASQNMGNYGRRSKFAQNMSPVAVFLKYPAEALARVTIRMFDDPVTGKASMRGLMSGPVPKEIAIAAVTTMLTKLMTRNDEDDPAGNLPRAQAGVLGRAMVIGNPVTGKALRNDKGQLITLDVDSYAEVMDSIYEHVKSVWDAVREGNLTPLQHQAGSDVRSMASHIAAPVRLPVELKYGVKAGSGAPVTSEQRAKMGTGKQAEDNRKTRGIGLSDAAVYALEQMGGPLTRTVEALRGESSTSGWNPFVKSVDPRQKMAEDTYEYGPEKYDQLANELDKGPAGDQEKINALLAWASKNPTLLKKWIADYRSGSRAYAKDAGQTVEQRRENRLSRMPEPSGR